ncbi:methyltransferase SirN-like protein [Colletotrichum falcatum]|nr:methyltransferase SirN-like protein [Colletotrichum falcatum]
MDNFMEMTRNAGHTTELQRLADLHATYRDAMEENLVLAPINLDEPGKRILDSGTADGTWLRDLRRSQSAQHQYVGSDVVSELFPAQPDGLTYFQHSFKDPWPEELRSSFDLVHVRGSLAGSSPSKPGDVVKNLCTLVKPGGWVQLMEMNAFKAPSNGPAMEDFAKMATQLWTGIGVGDFANELKSYLEEAGMQNTRERRITCNIGRAAKPELRARSVNGVTGPIRPLVSVAKTVQTTFTEDELDSMYERVKSELENEGGRIEVVIAWGQRPSLSRL